MVSRDNPTITTVTGKVRNNETIYLLDSFTVMGTILTKKTNKVVKQVPKSIGEWRLVKQGGKQSKKILKVKCKDW